MTKKESLIAKLQEKGAQLTGKETVVQLEAMLKPTSKPEGSVNETLKSDKTAFEIWNGDTHIRTYTVEIHGDDAEKLANQYAGKIGGTVK